EYEYYILNKPRNVISSTQDELGRETVVDFIETNKQVFPVGRLDRDTTGLVLLTNDGNLAHMLLHPKYHVPKTYVLTIAGEVTDKQVKFFEKGVILDEQKTLPAKAKIIKKTDTETIIEAVLFEGRFQQIRRMCYALHLELTNLKRIKFGPIELGDLKEGGYRSLTKSEIQALQESATTTS
ncbi:MAG: rRNA pseudouridine synthase, partial [Patescibacteria group bacterium]|nr:rRNA pseudouridine synthase [Patescibacteria group bacterium]